MLVVGASGQLGTALCEQLGAAALGAARRQLQPEWLRLDLEELAANPALLDGLLESHGITAVMCAAGATDVERCESDHGWAHAANHLGPLALARAARNMPFVFFSTDYVFDGIEHHGPGSAGPYTEDAPAKALSVYGQSKLDGERAILDAHPHAMVLRTTTVYGPDPQAKNFLYTLNRLLSAGKPMRVPNDQWSTPTHNADLAAASIALLQRGETGIFHLAGPDFLHRYDFALKACAILGLDPSTMAAVTTPELQQKAPRPLMAGLHIGKLQSVLGNDVMRPVEQGVRAWQASLAETA